MMEVSWSARRLLIVLPLLIHLIAGGFTVTYAHGFTESQGQSSLLNPFGASQGSDMIPLSSGMFSPFLPKIPNLELGYLYSFGNRVSTGRFTADYLLPYSLNEDSVLFGEAHAEGWNFWKSPDLGGANAWASNRIDLSFGGGYRTMLRGGNTLVGVNGFYDASRLYNKWYSSGGFGLEMAANVAGDDAIDLNFNWYGNLFNRDALVNAFRNKGNSFDLEAGYSHALFDRAMDLRLKFAGYQFDVGNAVYGWRTGADLTTRNGMFTLRYEYGSDRIDGNYNTVGGFVNVGFQLENLLSGESPLTLPEPVFKSPRDLRRLLGLKVKRNWNESVAACGVNHTPPQLQPANVIRYIYLATGQISDFNLPTNPIIPTLTTTRYTVCWFGYLGQPQSVILAVSDGVRFTNGLPTFIIKDDSGCVPLTAAFLSPANPLIQKNGLINPNGQVFDFAPGGGISVQVNQ